MLKEVLARFVLDFVLAGLRLADSELAGSALTGVAAADSATAGFATAFRQPADRALSACTLLASVAVGKVPVPFSLACSAWEELNTPV